MAKNRYMNECSVCGCPLDPGEGKICEDCLEAERQQRSIIRPSQVTVPRQEHRRKGLVAVYA